jgi:hypothetical protein
MAKNTFAPDSRWTVSQDCGVGPGYIPAGAELVVSAVYPPGTPGIGHADEDVVMAHYERPDASPQTVAWPVSIFTAACKAAS